MKVYNFLGFYLIFVSIQLASRVLDFITNIQENLNSAWVQVNWRQILDPGMEELSENLAASC